MNRNLHEEPFPSGEWTGFYLYPAEHEPERHWMVLYLELAEGRIRGGGHDYVGPFNISGTYEEAAGEYRWVKQYVGQHAVLYRGKRQGTGIAGVWEIEGIWSGGFFIWPRGWGDLEESLLERDSG